MNAPIGRVNAGSKRKLWLHVGTNKTASSYIQSILVNNEDILREYGYCYPETGREDVHGRRLHQHLNLAMHLLTGSSSQASQAQKFDDKSFYNLLGQLIKEIKPYQNIIVSSEAIQNTEYLETDRVKYFFSFFEEVEVIIYLREHASYLQSWFNSRTRRGVQKESFEKFCNGVSIDYSEKVDYFNHFPKVKRIHARPFVNSLMKNQDVFDDFLSILSPDFDPYDFSKAASQANASIPDLAVEFLLIVNNLEVKVERGGEFIERISAVFRGLAPRPNGNMMTKKLMDSIREKYKDDSKALSEKYFSKATLGYDFSFSELAPLKSQDADYQSSLTTADIINCAEHLKLTLYDKDPNAKNQEELISDVIHKWNLSCSCITPGRGALRMINADL